MKEMKKGDKVLWNEKIMTVTSVRDGGWQDLVTITDGTETLEVGEYNCVFAPDGNPDDADVLSRYLWKNGICGEVSQYGQHTEVFVEWGDWKHDHGFCDHLMGLVCYKSIGETVTEEDGSDCYSAIHTYKKM